MNPVKPTTKETTKQIQTVQVKYFVYLETYEISQSRIGVRPPGTGMILFAGLYKFRGHFRLTSSIH